MTENYGISPVTPEDYEKLYAIWLAGALGVASKHFKSVMEKYGSFEEIYKLGEKQYIECGVEKGSVIMKRLLDKELSGSSKIFGFCKHYLFGMLIYTSEYYPKRLKLISDPPPVLYVRGRWVDLNDNVCIAVVGTRSYSEQGWKSTYMISEGLAKCGAVVVTGLASGIDTAAATASLAASGMTVGVLGTGIERVYPSENKPLFDKMYEKGTVISELPPFSGTSPAYFPVRNRIISGLCHGVLVGEGAEKSGAMITASHAAEQGRHVFAIPGDISSPESSGVNKLINEGATPVFDAWNILEKYYYTYPHRLIKLENANGSIVPPERSSKRIRVTKSKKGSTAKSTPTSRVYEEKEGKSTTPKDIPVQSDSANTVTEKVNAESPKTPTTKKTAALPAALEEFDEIGKSVYAEVPETGYIAVDKIIIKTGIGAGIVIATVSALETAGLITLTPQGLTRGHNDA